MIMWSYTVIPAGSVAGTDTVLTDAGAGEARTIDQVMIKDLALDPATGDLALPPRYVTGAEAFAQRLSIRFQFWLGEHFLDLRQGIPYLKQVFIKAPRLDLIERLYRNVVLTTPGAAAVERFRMTFDRPRRELTVEDLKARLVTGDTFVATSSPFILPEAT